MSFRKPRHTERALAQHSDRRCADLPGSRAASALDPRGRCRRSSAECPSDRPFDSVGYPVRTHGHYGRMKQQGGLFQILQLPGEPRKMLPTRYLMRPELQIEIGTSWLKLLAIPAGFEPATLCLE